MWERLRLSLAARSLVRVPDDLGGPVDRIRALGANANAAGDAWAASITATFDRRKR
ncbi:hypothetical protein XFF6166_370032 [Xanthomonas citri pv. fuscans]|nr:hypothetical protein XFF6166_370032 [Xanthomonas citri pv. fuscans]SON99537.1 hypothetical protein XFF6960_180033 [Xanthomonas citri pv. fuscans]SOO05856.1 hypothetical protein XFF7767_50085 [Xanthomonas citri pv. fuscans]SOO07230.1 hypothetical protein XFF6970_10040 [Xanthomonas citri pv. fuscans]SOO13639.1 hypothetical protein XFF7766_200074 [Xanthomonas citri pv. fuscans]